jgi:hypothetical protein
MRTWVPVEKWQSRPLESALRTQLEAVEKERDEAAVRHLEVELQRDTYRDEIWKGVMQIGDSMSQRRRKTPKL